MRQNCQTKLTRRRIIQSTGVGVAGLVTATATGAIHSSVASAMTEGDEIRQNNEQAVRDFLDLLSNKRMDAWLELWDEDGVQDMPFSPPGFPKRVEGKAAIARHYSALPTSVGRMVFPDLVTYPMLDPNTILAEYRGEIEILATGKPYNNIYAGLFQFRNGKILLFREYYDPMVFTQAWGDSFQTNGTDLRTKP
ncbi:MAG: nuclear transport factor 2 family protein [Cyanobacteriota bacterium]